MLTDDQIRELLRYNLGLSDIDKGGLVFICTDDFFLFASEIEKVDLPSPEIVQLPRFVATPSLIFGVLVSL